MVEGGSDVPHGLDPVPPVVVIGLVKLLMRRMQEGDAFRVILDPRLLGLFLLGEFLAFPLLLGEFPTFPLLLGEFLPFFLLLQRVLLRLG
ncbi:MAG: hypothetical protein ACLQGP_00585 [Isosphaeraceae bacterium]